MQWNYSPVISLRIKYIISKLNLHNIQSSRIFCFSSLGSSSRAIARIWSLPRIWQLALRTSPGYCLEVISEKYGKLSPDDQDKVLIHELLHIPKVFSGNLRPHRNRYRRSFNKYQLQVDYLFSLLKNK